MLSDGTTVSTATVYKSTGTGGQLTNHSVRYGTRKEIPEMQCCGSGMNHPGSYFLELRNNLFG
jgi:hypothetical protein